MGEGHKKDDKKEEKKEEEILSIVYKVALHCWQCGVEVQKYLTTLEGVHKVEVDVAKSKVTLKGKVDAKKVLQKLEKKINRKVELIEAKKEEKKKEEKKESKKEVSVTKTVLKVHIHCEKCELDMKKEMMKLKDIYSVKTDFKAQTCTVEGIMDEQKIVKHLRKKFKKKACVEPRPKVEVKKKEEEKKVEVKVVEKKEGEKGEEKKKETAPYIIHYVYAPQTFSDENPNACNVM